MIITIVGNCILETEKVDSRILLLQMLVKTLFLPFNIVHLNEYSHVENMNEEFGCLKANHTRVNHLVSISKNNFRKHNDA